jgi:uncharacterized membrane protein YraQ (UPF0718 family)
MLIPTLLMAALALGLLALAVWRGQGEHVAGTRAAAQMTLQILPLLLFAFLAAGLVQVMLPRELVSTWVGEESGLRGLLVGALAGTLTPGGPYVSLPLAAGLLKAGAGTGTMVAFLTSWGLVSAARLPMEVAILGWRFTAIRLASSVLLAPLAGLLANILVRLLRPGG